MNKNRKRINKNYKSIFTGRNGSGILFPDEDAFIPVKQRSNPTYLLTVFPYNLKIAAEGNILQTTNCKMNGNSLY